MVEASTIDVTPYRIKVYVHDTIKLDVKLYAISYYNNMPVHWPCLHLLYTR